MDVLDIASDGINNKLGRRGGEWRAVSVPGKLALPQSVPSQPPFRATLSQSVPFVMRNIAYGLEVLVAAAHLFPCF